ncbi:bifunctional sugar phosphate isomerase/epimerase/4-hydroxyphenylpyruvate dioxygenase family protein [Paraburkholderia fungorum]|uniref:bifunctional sugar phosphate isomerase/epimerase/4-hydroxyphenylpyruvate dioxygenase family protein n=1 Tax=Paraburkholderia fungorum TaxID=134537 RepID=UPI00161B571F|nr:sugar phosphate isomerase/epimerase and 4-hydroxyphenylpyruvate domain-containing protein [Paraburkholderia fungorum]MBB5547479.1 4-hydroxyphenylpyruvate dioxygenase [Paraburkholderia fungorum]
MLRSIATVSMSGGLLEKLDAASAAGFGGIELFEQDLTSSAFTPAEVRKACEDRGLAIVLFQPFRDFEGVTAPLFQRNMERARRKFDLMHKLGATRLLVCSNVSSTDTIGDDGLIIEQLGALAALAQSSGITAGYEALAWGRHVNRWRHAWELVRSVNSPALGVVLDSFHILACGDSLGALTDVPGERITFVQIADAPRMSMDFLSWSRHHRCFPGQGDFDLSLFLRQILDAGYSGPLSLEVFSDTCRMRPAGVTASDAYRSLTYLESAAALPGVTSWPEGAKPLSSPASVSGFEFVELAVDITTATQLELWLQQAGFTPVARHRTKDVSLLFHGKAAVVLNAQPRSFASQYYSAHGASACAWAYRAADTSGFFARAAQLGFGTFEEQRLPSELKLEGIVGPSGSLHYFLGDNERTPRYLSDFSFFSAPSIRGRANDTEISKIDHIALNVPFEESDSWTLFYRALFGLEPEGRSLAASPYGLVQTVSLRNPEGTLRVALHASELGRTEVTTAIAQYSGGGLNHLALACVDLMGALEKLESRGDMLPIPANYYEDLRARYGEGLPLERMQRLGVLYDREPGGGEFFHAYTKPFQGRFHLELVQRVNGYDGYGAVNEPVRLAVLGQIAAPVDAPLPRASAAARATGRQLYPVPPRYSASNSFSD